MRIRKGFRQYSTGLPRGTRASIIFLRAGMASLLWAGGTGLAAEAAGDDQDQASEPRYTMVEYFTAATLTRGEVKLGFDLDYGVSRDLMVGTDLLATTIGAPTLQAKWRFARQGPHTLAFSLSGAWLNKQTVLWGHYADHFETLDARILRPAISWTNRISPRLNIHSYWSIGLGKPRATLSEKGKRALWEMKHPDGNYDTRETTEDEGIGEDGENINTSKNQESENADSFARRSLEIQSLTGLMNDIFQVTGEFRRSHDKRILITSRIERMILEDLRSNGIRLTVAQQWIFNTFQFRLGVGLRYQVISGRDLDGEELDKASVLPATDIDFYWRF